MRVAVRFTLATIVAATIAVFTSGYAQAQEAPAAREQMTVLRKGNSPSPPTAKQLDDAATPIVDLEAPTAPAAEGSDRYRKNGRYDNRSTVMRDVHPGVAAYMRTNPYGDIADMPTGESDLIVEGDVTDSAAFLSNDKGAVYSEFTVRVTDVLKAAPDVSVRPADAIATERWGGRVRYPDGRVVRYGITGYGSPKVGRKYVFLLANISAGTFEILTGYELLGNTVRALDGSRINYGGLGRWSCDKHNDQDYQAFMTELAEAIKNPPPPRRIFNP